MQPILYMAISIKGEKRKYIHVGNKIKLSMNLNQGDVNCFNLAKMF